MRRLTQRIEIVKISPIVNFFLCFRSQKNPSPTQIILPWTLDKNHAKKPPAFEPREVFREQKKKRLVSTKRSLIPMQLAFGKGGSVSNKRLVSTRRDRKRIRQPAYFIEILADSVSSFGGRSLPYTRRRHGGQNSHLKAKKSTALLLDERTAFGVQIKKAPGF